MEGMIIMTTNGQRKKEKYKAYHRKEGWLKRLIRIMKEDKEIVKGAKRSDSY
jgi:hypothetical protein